MKHMNKLTRNEMMRLEGGGLFGSILKGITGLFKKGRGKIAADAAAKKTGELVPITITAVGTAVVVDNCSGRD